jgi:hypothetical protein
MTVVTSRQLLVVHFIRTSVKSANNSNQTKHNTQLSVIIELTDLTRRDCVPAHCICNWNILVTRHEHLKADFALRNHYKGLQSYSGVINSNCLLSR